MKAWIAAFALCAACALSVHNGASALDRAAPAYTVDARSSASDEEIRQARRAYRAACQRHQSDGYCECMTGGMAQALVPEDLRQATALIPHHLGHAPAPIVSNQRSLARIDAARAEFEPGCAQFRR